MRTCPTCRRPLPAELPAGLHREIVRELGLCPHGATTKELAQFVERRRGSVERALAMLQAAGVVVRDVGGEGRGWRARRWRLAESPPGPTLDSREGGSGRPAGQGGRMTGSRRQRAGEAAGRASA